MGRGRPATVDPFRELVGGDQIGLPAAAQHRGIQLGVSAGSQYGPVRKAHVLLRARAEPVQPVGPAAAGLPVRGDVGAFDGDDLGGFGAHLPQCLRLGRDSHGLGSGTDDGQSRGHPITSVTSARRHASHKPCSSSISDAFKMSGKARHCTTRFGGPSNFMTPATNVSSCRTAAFGSGIGGADTRQLLVERQSPRGADVVASEEVQQHLRLGPSAQLHRGVLAQITQQPVVDSIPWNRRQSCRDVIDCAVRVKAHRVDRGEQPHGLGRVGVPHHRVCATVRFHRDQRRALVLIAPTPPPGHAARCRREQQVLQRRPSNEKRGGQICVGNRHVEHEGARPVRGGIHSPRPDDGIFSIELIHPEPERLQSIGARIEHVHPVAVGGPLRETAGFSPSRLRASRRRVRPTPPARTPDRVRSRGRSGSTLQAHLVDEARLPTASDRARDRASRPPRRRGVRQQRKARRQSRLR